jgi:hypothetical protein
LALRNLKNVKPITIELIALGDVGPETVDIRGREVVNLLALDIVNLEFLIMILEFCIAVFAKSGKNLLYLTYLRQKELDYDRKKRTAHFGIRPNFPGSPEARP